MRMRNLRRAHDRDDQHANQRQHAQPHGPVST
jgi:hypothetical protein